MLIKALPLSVGNMFSPDQKHEMKKTVSVTIKVVLVLMVRWKKVKITGVRE